MLGKSTYYIEGLSKLGAGDKSDVKVCAHASSEQSLRCNS